MARGALLLLALAAGARAAVPETECVVLLHGLARGPDSLAELERKLGRSGFDVVNIGYPSLRRDARELADDAVSRGLAGCRERGAARVHFVTHSLGGILVRHYLQRRAVPRLGRVVMLSPPNQGARIVDRLRRMPGFSLLGPAGTRLGTGPGSIADELGPVEFELGVIAGDLDINPLSPLLIRAPNDSIVSVASTRVEGMDAHIVLPVMHTVMMRDDRLIDHVIHFLKTGAFMPR